MNDFCFDLKLDIPFLKKGLDPFKSFLPLYHIGCNAEKIVNPKIISFLNSIGVSFVSLTSFYCEPYIDSIVHIDEGNFDYAKLNFIYGGDDSLMNWFHPLVPGTLLKPEGAQVHSESGFNLGFLTWEPDQLEVIHQQKIGSAGICRVGIPHNITTKSQKRRCFSMHISHLDTGKRIMWEDAKEIFKDFAIE